jgi:DNA-binding transcriptional ArsR family regulator
VSKGSITTEETEKLSAVFGALADPTRRGIIERVRVESKTVAELASDFAISLPAVSKHLKVLDKAGLVHRAKSGKYILCSYNPEPGRAAMKWINEQHRFWQDSFAGLAEFLDKRKTTENGTDNNPDSM